MVPSKDQGLKDQEPDTWLDLVREHFGIGRSRAYEYISCADGKKTASEINAEKADSMKRSRANAVHNVVDSNSDDLRKSLYECNGPLT
jgi:hypothetical protein